MGDEEKIMCVAMSTFHFFGCRDTMNDMSMIHHHNSHYD